MAGKLKDSRQIGQFLIDFGSVVSGKRRSADRGEILWLEGCDQDQDLEVLIVNLSKDQIFIDQTRNSYREANSKYFDRFPVDSEFAR